MSKYEIWRYQQPADKRLGGQTGWKYKQFDVKSNDTKIKTRAAHVNEMTPFVSQYDILKTNGVYFPCQTGSVLLDRG